MSLPRDNIGQHRNNTLCPQRQRRGNLVVVTGINIQLIAAQRQNLGDLGKVSAGFLDRDNIRDIAELGVGSR